MKADSLKAVIEAELEKESPDWRLIESVSRGVVDSDPDNVRFSVDAAHIQRLGEELVAKQETALSELIKNAFDADATTVTLTFDEHRRLGGILTIEDDGSGMGEDVIRDAWMRISTAAKVNQPTSPRFSRVRAGRKGIGRFAVQRLGRRLVLESRPAGSAVGYRVAFDWDADFRAGRDLQDVFNSIGRFDKGSAEQGTKLIIQDLRDVWSDAAIERVWRSVILLQPPFEIRPIAPVASVRVEADPGFRVVINGVTQAQQTERFSIETDFLSRATAIIQGSVDKVGRAVVTVSSTKLELDDEQEFEVNVTETGPFSFEARYFIYSSDMLSGMKQAAAAEMGRKFGGVRVYRDGFRVLPYGEGRDDWLGLDDLTSRRSFLLPVNNFNFFGQVRLNSKDNPAFEETSSREGLLENVAFAELRDFLQEALLWGAGRVGSIRQRKIRAGQRGFISLRPSQLIRELRTNSEDGGHGSGGAAGRRDWDAAEEAIVQFERQVDAARAAALEYEEMLRILASLGISISVFGHEVKGAQGNLAARLKVIQGIIAKLSDPGDRERLSAQFDKLTAASDRLLDIGGYIAGLMSSTESRELRSLSVRGVLDRFAEQFTEYMRKQGVQFEVDVQPAQLRTMPMHSSELDSVLLNLLTNAIKSMRKAKVHERRVRIEGRQVGRHVVIGFEDNGGGILPENRERVFDPFYTTTTAADDDGVAGPGTGLGLKIVSDIATSYGGAATVGEPNAGYVCRIEFSVLEASQAEEIP
jgi:signal transduction histidine kinase